MPAHPAAGIHHSTREGDAVGRDPSAEESLAPSSNNAFEVGKTWKVSTPSSFGPEETTHVFSRSCTFQEPQSTTSPIPRGRGRSESREVGTMHGNPV